MGGMTRSLRTEIPERAGRRRSHRRILLNAEKTVKPRDDRGRRESPVHIVQRAFEDQDLRVPPMPHSISYSYFAVAASGAAIVNRIVPIKLTSFTCSPAWIST